MRQRFAVLPPSTFAERAAKITENEKKIVVRKEANIETAARPAGRESTSMATLSKETIEVIERLIETCHDGGEGFRIAAADVDDPEVRELLSGFSEQRERFAAEL